MTESMQYNIILTKMNGPVKYTLVVNQKQAVRLWSQKFWFLYLALSRWLWL